MELPSIRVAVTELCNLKCSYCPSAGDSVELQRKPIDRPDFERLIKAAIDVGFSNFSFTGGEPLLSPETTDMTFQLAELVKNYRKSDGYIKLNTNGANIIDYLKKIENGPFDELKISLDSLKVETFNKITRRGDKVFKRTLDGILAVKDKVPVRLQTVVGKYNEDEIFNIINFCIENKLDIKLFDISAYDNALCGSKGFAYSNFVPLSGIANTLSELYGDPVLKYAVGGVGHHKKVFTTPEGTRIELRDTTRLAHYSSKLCNNECTKYPCQDGLCNIVIAADGHIQPCREGEKAQTISPYDNNNKLLSDEALRSTFSKVAGIFGDAKAEVRRIGLPIVEAK